MQSGSRLITGMPIWLLVAVSPRHAHKFCYCCNLVGKENYKMAITATQGVMAVGLLSVLFGADLLTLLGSKVRPYQEVTSNSGNAGSTPDANGSVSLQNVANSSATRGPVSDHLSEGGKVHISFCSS